MLFRKRVLNIDQFTNFKYFFYPKWLILSWKLSLDYITKYVCFLNFSLEMIKQGKFFNVVNLSFDERLLNYYEFSLHLWKTVTINNIKVTYPEFVQQVSFPDSLGQIERIFDFIILVCGSDIRYSNKFREWMVID